MPNLSPRMLPQLLAAFLGAATAAQASTIWNGPPITFSHTPANGLQDHITTAVAFARGGSGGLYNSVAESFATANVSPKGTTWAVGSLANFNTLTYGPCPLHAGNQPPRFVGTTYVVHLVADDIYFLLTLTGWGGAGGSGNTTFSYTRTTAPAVAPPPTVSITNLVSGAVFAAPANVLISANAAVSSGSVTNVKFLSNGVSLGSVQAAPFNFTAANLAAGSYALAAVATAAGISTTSAVVNVSVVGAVPVTLSSSGVAGGLFSFSYTANPGLSYVVQSSPDLASWTPIVTNVASSSPVLFSAPFSSTAAKYYRVGRLPNP